MNDSYRTFFGLTKEPFSAELGIKELLETPDLKAVKDRFDYAVRLGAAALVTGEIGSGKSTALRYAAGHLHPSEYCTLHITATSGSITELYRQLLDELGAGNVSFSRALLLKRIRGEIMELVQGKKINVVLLIDEASLPRLEVLTELHALCQFEQDSKPWLPLILAGQANLVDKLMYQKGQSSGPGRPHRRRSRPIHDRLGASCPPGFHGNLLTRKQKGERRESL